MPPRTLSFDIPAPINKALKKAGAEVVFAQKKGTNGLLLKYTVRGETIEKTLSLSGLACGSKLATQLGL